MVRRRRVEGIHRGSRRRLRRVQDRHQEEARPARVLGKATQPHRPALRGRRHDRGQRRLRPRRRSQAQGRQDGQERQGRLQHPPKDHVRPRGLHRRLREGVWRLGQRKGAAPEVVGG